MLYEGKPFFFCAENIMELTFRKEKHAHVECNHVGNLENGCLRVSGLFNCCHFFGMKMIGLVSSIRTITRLNRVMAAK